VSAASSDVGENVIIQVTVLNSGAVKGSGLLIFTVDGLPVRSQVLNLKPGDDESYIHFWEAVEGHHILGVILELAYDPTPENNNQERTFIVQGDDKKDDEGEDDGFIPFISSAHTIFLIFLVVTGIQVAKGKRRSG